MSLDDDFAHFYQSWSGRFDPLETSDVQEKKGSPQRSCRPALRAWKCRKGRYPDPVTRKVAAFNRLSDKPAPFQKG